VNCATNAPVLTESDPKISTLTNAKWCSTNGSVITCTQNAPLTSYTETDPQVGTLTNAKWCTSDGAVVNCISNAPGGDNLGNHTATQDLSLGANSVVGSNWSIGPRGNSYGSIDISGGQSVYAGIRWTNAVAAGNGDTLMIGTNNVQGIFNQTDSAWVWKFTDGVLTTGSVPATALAASPSAAKVLHGDSTWSTVGAGEIAAGAVDTAQLANGAVTAAKTASGTWCGARKVSCTFATEVYASPNVPCNGTTITATCTATEYGGSVTGCTCPSGYSGLNLAQSATDAVNLYGSDGGFCTCVKN
jgi:hypothetical protein